MKAVKGLGLFVFSLLLVGFASANGLSIVSNNTFSINKTYNQNAYVNIAIKNDEPFSFYNVTLEENPYITISKIPVISSGETKNITAMINGNEDFIGDLKILGYYVASLGEQNKTHQIDITYADGPSRCEFSVIKGDKINWTNLEVAESKKVDLVNSQTGNLMQTIQPQASWLQWLDTEMVLPFHIVDRTGWPGEECMLTVLGDSGYINNPELDTKINLNLKVIYPNTNIEVFFLSSNYSMEFYETKEDIFSIKNNGTEIAKNINLNADWFSFTQNDFDLAPGESRNIGYTINPRIYKSNETDKTYTKELTIIGNFQEIKHEFGIFIKYAELVNNTNQNATTLKDYICENFPEFCEPQVVYKYVDDGEREFNMSYTQNQVKNLYDLFYDFLDEQAIKDKQLAELNDEINGKLLTIENSTSNTGAEISGIDERIDTANGAWMFAAWIIGMVVTGLILATIALKYKEKYRENEWTRYG